MMTIKSNNKVFRFVLMFFAFGILLLPFVFLWAATAFAQTTTETISTDIQPTEISNLNTAETPITNIPASDTAMSTTTATSSVPAEVATQATSSNPETTEPIVSTSTDGVVAETSTETELDSIGTGEDNLVAEELPLTNVTYNDNNYYQFSKTACVPMEGGNFYCVNNDTAQEDNLKQDLFAAPDSDGDMEIYVRTKDGLQQISFNQVDDNAPYYDAVSKTIVWQRFIDNRYQIISYDTNTGSESVLSDGVSNNMEPNRFDRITVWQKWIDNNWEIVMYDGRREVRLTNSTYHDLAPQVRGEFILWKTIKGAEQIVSVYDIKTATVTEISGEDSENVLKNPRMVLVYDAFTEDGEILTKGYDPTTGRLISLATETGDTAPIEIPPTDQTGETRAFIQNKQVGGKDDGVNNDNDKIGGNGDDDDGFTLELPTVEVQNATSTAISTSTPDLVIPPLNSGNLTASTTENIEIPDLVIPPVATTSAAQ